MTALCYAGSIKRTFKLCDDCMALVTQDDAAARQLMLRTIAVLN